MGSNRASSSFESRRPKPCVTGSTAFVVGVGVTACFLGLVGRVAIPPRRSPGARRRGIYPPRPHLARSRLPAPVECALAFQCANAAFKRWMNLLVAFADHRTATAQIASDRDSAYEMRSHVRATQCTQSGSFETSSRSRHDTVVVSPRALTIRISNVGAAPSLIRSVGTHLFQELGLYQSTTNIEVR